MAVFVWPRSRVTTLVDEGLKVKVAIELTTTTLRAFFLNLQLACLLYAYLQAFNVPNWRSGFSS